MYLNITLCRMLLCVMNKCSHYVHFESFVTYFVASCPRHLGLKENKVFEVGKEALLLSQVEVPIACVLSIFIRPKKYTNPKIFYVDLYKNWFVDNLSSILIIICVIALI